MSNLNIDSLAPGMVIENDIYTTDNQLIICKDTIATPNIIKRLKYFKIKEITIYEDGKKTPTKDETFIAFKQDYKRLENKMSNTLNKLIMKEYSKNDIEDMINDSFSLYNSQSSSLVMLKMLNQINNDDIIFTHSLNVGIIGLIIGKWCGISEEKLSLILQCGLFHDIGKLLIPKSTLFKNDKLTLDEFAELKSHTVEGYNLLKSLDINEEVANVALLHHERLNGSGYPLQLRDEQINNFSEFTKIISIADVYDGITSNRSYKRKQSPFSAFSYFEKEGLNLFDPLCIMTFLKNAVNSYIGDTVRLSDERIGTIVMINNTSYGRPIVKIDNKFIDLAKYDEKDLTIIDIL